MTSPADTSPEVQAFLDRFNAMPRASRARCILYLLDEEPDFRSVLEEVLPDPVQRALFVESLRQDAEAPNEKASS
ncbi:MAG: hypothetical protein H6975_05205 [Gammaproteobacteria bacterium]|nr:hypothetical protein [Gammaproteobacteria bacterium]